MMKIIIENIMKKMKMRKQKEMSIMKMKIIL